MKLETRTYPYRVYQDISKYTNCIFFLFSWDKSKSILFDITFHQNSNDNCIFNWYIDYFGSIYNMWFLVIIKLKINMDNVAFSFSGCEDYIIICIVLIAYFQFF